jgi:hypothetical protein
LRIQASVVKVMTWDQALVVVLGSRSKEVVSGAASGRQA